MLTEYYSGAGVMTQTILTLSRWLAPKLYLQLCSRSHPELDSRTAFCPVWRFLWLKASVRQRGARAEFFAQWRNALAKSYAGIGFGQANVVHGFVRNVPPELCALARQRGLAVSADQMIAPAAVERQEDQRQHARWPGWEPGGPRTDYGDFESAERATWAELHLITCASLYVRDGLIEQGIAAERIAVAPYPIDVEEFTHFDRSDRKGPVTVGFVGSVNLRKGAPYFLEVARRLASPGVRFVMLGPVKIAQARVEANRDVAEIVGAVPLAEVSDWLRRFDMIYFPTTCEGSAGALMEAMATGLPVVTSPNSGTVARDAQEGFIVDYDDTEAAADRIQRLIDDPSLRLTMGRAARERVGQFDIDHYGRRLRELFEVRLASATTGNSIAL